MSLEGTPVLHWGCKCHPKFPVAMIQYIWLLRKVPTYQSTKVAKGRILLEEVALKFNVRRLQGIIKVDQPEFLDCGVNIIPDQG